MLLMAFFMPYAANAYNHQVLVGDETSNDMLNPAAPFHTNKNYSYAQMIYTAAQINEDCAYAGNIESISFHILRPSAKTTVPIKVYMKTTTKNAFSSATNWESVTEDDIVYEGDVSTDFGENVFEGWVTITFDQPFAYDGTSNLLIAINKDYYETGRDNRWQYTPTTDYQVLSIFNDNTSYDPTIVSTAGTLSQKLPNIIFNMTLDHPFPTNVTLNDASGSTATISWTAPQTTNTITNYAYEYTDRTTTWNGTTTSTTLNLSNLTAETEYQFQVKAVYSDGESCWSALDFSSLEDCPTPVNLTASNITSHSAVISWIGSGADSYTLQMGSMGNTASSTETVLSESFEDGDMPEGWTTTEGAWEVSDYYEAATGIYYAENFTDPDILITPAMDLSSASSATLSFNFMNTPFVDEDTDDTYTFVLNVYYRVNGGDWNLLYTNGDEYDDWEPIEINLIGMAANYQIGFECTINEDYGEAMGLDDIEVVAEMAGGITWTTVDDNASKPFTLDNLTAETTYRVRVFSVCGGVPGEPSEPLSFVTLPIPTFTKHIDGYHGNDGGYYLIASPVAEPITPTAENGFITAAYDLYAFDESEELEWRNIEAQAFTQLVSGQGYLYASNEDTELIFTGEPYNGDGKVTLQKTTGAEFEGWNLVGNPFADSAYLDRPYYRSNGAAVINNLENGVIYAMEGVFVIAQQDEQKITFSANASKSKIARLSVDLTQNNSLLDRAIVRFDEGHQLPKFQLRKNSTKVFIPQEGKDYAVVRSEEIGALPVNFKAENSGTYTLSFTTEEMHFAYLHLIDNMTGNDVDLLATPSYSFNAKTTDYESRFKLVFATGNNSTDDNFAFYSNGSFVINNEGIATLQVFDINGRILNSESINGCTNIEVNAASGIYMFRLVSGNDVKVQKVVVR